MEQDTRGRLEDILDREIEVAHSLAASLAAERAALTGDSPQAVEQKATDKIRIFGLIEKLETERRSLCATPGAQGLAATVADRLALLQW